MTDAEWIRGRARAAGFDLCGVVRAAEFAELERFEEWLSRGYQGEMKYLEDPRRRDPSRVMPKLRSVIVCGLNYNAALPYSVRAGPPEPEPAGSEARAAVDDKAFQAHRNPHSQGWVSRYAWGDDYHQVLWGRLNTLEAELKQRFTQPFESRAYADTGPIAERVLAKHAGLGWIGKNTLLLNREIGSWVFLGVILTSLELQPTIGIGESLPPDLCGSCRKCIDACPTDALVQPYVMDARRCISYLTIELRGSIPEQFRKAMGWQVYGCDICQDVCPYNRKAPVTSLGEFEPRTISVGKSLYKPELAWLAGLTEDEFRTIFRGSAIKRAKWHGLVRNACIALGNAGLRRAAPEDGEAIAVLERLAGSFDLVIQESAQWAVGCIR